MLGKEISTEGPFHIYSSEPFNPLILMAKFKKCHH